MKKIYIYILMLASMVVAGAAMVSCNKEETITGEFSMTVKATKGGGNAKALDLDGHTLNAIWAVGERVTVHNDTRDADLEGYLEAQVAGESTTLCGNLTGTIEAGNVLTLKFCSPSYSSQDGTLEYIAANCDYATATVTVTSVGDGKISTDNANFQNQQAIVKFTLQKMADNNDLDVTQLVVNDGTSAYTVTPASATNELFVAIPATGNVNLSSPIDDAITYFYKKTGANLTAGKYYEIGVKMRREVNLANVTENITLQNGDSVIGTLGADVEISIADGATVTFSGANINNNSKSKSASCAGITCLGNATINLTGGFINNINSSSDGHPSIQAGPQGNTLTIQGTGSLNVQGGSNAAGIGGGSGITCGNISLKGGAITACGGQYGAGIGSGQGGTCGNIEIVGGEITATGGEGAAGIGSGSGINTVCGNIYLYGGIINACGGNGAAGIGSGSGGTCSSIEIEGGTITAQGGSNAAGIGSGQNGHCGNVEIEGGSINATGGEGAGNIGAGEGGECGTVTLHPINGLFSVSSTKQVRFSRGNLLSDGSFAVNQYTYGDYFSASNSYNGPAGWDALTTDEWDYLYQHSTFGFATVNDIHGLIILPDGYSGSAINVYNPQDGSRILWNDNIYSGNAWTAMENNGVVFLPAAGYYETSFPMGLNNQGDEGCYLSSSGSVYFRFVNKKEDIYIGGTDPWSTSINPNESVNTREQYSVRLVRTN